MVYWVNGEGLHMKLIACEDCGKRYDFEKDDFCPKCGAFNPPVKTWGTDAQGNVIRVDGVNEANHEKSFVHSEVHHEKRVRRAAGLDQTPAKKTQRPSQSQRKTSQAGKPLLLVVLIIAAAVVIGNIVLPLLVYLLNRFLFF